MTYIKFILFIFCFIGLKNAYVIRSDARCACTQWNLSFECAYDEDCYWDSNTKTCKQQICSNITNQSVCAADVICQYRNGVCENFTKCEDLLGTTINQCRLMSTNCQETNGTNCLNTINEKNCSQIQQEGQCLSGQDGKCIWLASSNNCILWTKCSQATTSAQCNDSSHSCDWSDSLNSCVQLKCSEIESESTCFAVWEGPNSHLYDLCAWNVVTGKCEETNAESLDFEECSQNTLQAYHWSSNDASEGYCEICLSTNVQKPSAKLCDCSQLQIESDCQQNKKCQWQDSKCQNKKCSEIDPPQACLQNTSCAWYQNQCSNFTTCSDYKANSNLECASINTQCLISSSLSSCTSQYTSCKDHKTDDMCNAGKSSTSQQCYWDPNNSVCADWTECSQQQQATYCDYSGACFWESGVCNQLQCSHFHETTCSHYLKAPNSNEWKYCMLLDTCKEVNISLLDQEECYSNTFGIGYWNSNSCQQCSSAFGEFLYIFLFIFLLSL